MSAYARTRKALGLCFYCILPVGPVNKSYCKWHRELRRLWERARKRGIPKTPAPNPMLLIYIARYQHNVAALAFIKAHPDVFSEDRDPVLAYAVYYDTTERHKWEDE